MHEAGIAMSVLETCLLAARREGAERIVRIELRVGALAGVVPEALTFAFDALKRGTQADAAELSITRVPYDARCSGCDLEFPVHDAWAVAPCPACGEPSVIAARGDELMIGAMDVV